MSTTSQVIIALDFSDADRARRFVDLMQPNECRLKIGKELFTSAGPDFVREVAHRGFDVFLDLKFHDIPNTVAQACAAAAKLGVWMMNVHALGGEKMLRVAREALGENIDRPKLIAVTILTSMDDTELMTVGLAGSAESNVQRLAQLARHSRMDGVVCSPREATMLRSECGPDFLLVTPGVRPTGSASDDQSRVTTPSRAIENGANYLVIGRPITAASDPRRVLDSINEEILQAKS